MKLCLYDHYLKVEGRAARDPPPVFGEGVVPLLSGNKGFRPKTNLITSNGTLRVFW